MIDPSADVALGDNEMEWETLPDGLKDDETFVHALRDLSDSRFMLTSLRLSHADFLQMETSLVPSMTGSIPILLVYKPSHSPHL